MFQSELKYDRIVLGHPKIAITLKVITQITSTLRRDNIKLLVFYAIQRFIENQS